MSSSPARGPLASPGSLGLQLPDRASFQRVLSQQARLLTLVTALPDAALLPERFQGHEGVSTDFRFEIDCLSASAHLELKQLIGEPLTLRVLLADGRSHRSWHGVVTEAAQLGADGGLARYRLVMEPRFACLRQSRSSRIFQDQSVQEVCAAVLADYPELDFEFRLSRALQPRPLVTQYRESDADFVCRLLASEALSRVFLHDQTRSVAEADGEHGLHRLVVFDADTPVPLGAEARIRFHRADATEATDTIQQWQPLRTLTAGQIQRSAWDPAALHAPAGSAALAGLPAGIPWLEDYDHAAAQVFRDDEHATVVARQFGDVLALRSNAIRARGSVRQLAPATRFTLTEHAGLAAEAAEFTVLELRHEGANNLAAGIRAPDEASGTVERGSYRNEAICVPAALALVPPPPPVPVSPGLQTALVVGPAGAAGGSDTASERDGRVRIQFHWQRGAQPNPGGFNHERERAPGDLTNGIWVRVAESLAGPNWGSSFTPRVGTEVLVDFDGGDIDHPVIVGSLYKGEDAPPWAAGEASGANHAGVLAGIHAPTLDGAGWSQWQLDDSTGQLRTRLASSAMASQLNLGYLVQHAPTGGKRGNWRGLGFELATDGWQVQRAAKGMLLSATARQNGASTQLDASEAAAQLTAAADTAQRLSDAAAQSEADALTQAGRIEAFGKSIHPEDPPSDGDGMPDRALKSFEAPAMVVEAPASVAFATSASATLFAGEQLAAVVQADAQLSAQHTASLVSGEASSLYTHAGGIKAIAANAPLSIQAHDGPLEILADKDVSVTSSNDAIHVLAKEKIVLQAGQSSITLEGGNITFACPGKFEIKATQKALLGGGREAAELEILPAGQTGRVSTDPLAPATFDQFFILRWANSGKPIGNRRFRIKRQDGSIQTGKTDAQGRSPLLDTATIEERLSVLLLRDDLV